MKAQRTLVAGFAWLFSGSRSIWMHSSHASLARPCIFSASISWSAVSAYIVRMRTCVVLKASFSVTGSVGWNICSPRQRQMRILILKALTSSFNELQSLRADSRASEGPYTGNDADILCRVSLWRIPNHYHLSITRWKYILPLKQETQLSASLGTREWRGAQKAAWHKGMIWSIVGWDNSNIVS